MIWSGFPKPNTVISFTISGSRGSSSGSLYGRKLAGGSLKPFTIQGWCWISLMDALCCESRISILEIKCVHSVTDQLKCQHCIVKQSNSVTYLATAMMDTQHDILKFFLAELTCLVRQMVLVHKLRCIVQFQDTRHRLRVRYTAGLESSLEPDRNDCSIGRR